MHNPQADAIFRTRYSGCPNFMTPRIHDRRMIAVGHLAVELSSGNSMDHEHSHAMDTLWGVTVLIKANPNERHALNQSFSTRAEAEAYIETLRSWRPDN